MDCISLYIQISPSAKMNLCKNNFLKVLRYSINFSKCTIHGIYRRGKLKTFISLVTTKGVLTFPECLIMFRVVLLVSLTI